MKTMSAFFFIEEIKTGFNQLWPFGKALFCIKQKSDQEHVVSFKWHKDTLHFKNRNKRNVTNTYFTFWKTVTFSFFSKIQAKTFGIYSNRFPQGHNISLHKRDKPPYKPSQKTTWQRKWSWPLSPQEGSIIRPPWMD